MSYDINSNRTHSNNVEDGRKARFPTGHIQATLENFRNIYLPIGRVVNRTYFTTLGETEKSPCPQILGGELLTGGE
jgi:hypothetical protein